MISAPCPWAAEGTGNMSLSLQGAKDKGRGCEFSCFRTGMQTWRRAHKQGVGAMVLQERLRGLLA